MPISSIIVSALVVTMFATFALALAYGQYQTRNIKQVPGVASPEQEREQQRLKAA
jgi:hypothetical protein